MFFFVDRERFRIWKTTGASLIRAWCFFYGPLSSFKCLRWLVSSLCSVTCQFFERPDLSSWFVSSVSSSNSPCQNRELIKFLSKHCSYMYHVACVYNVKFESLWRKNLKNFPQIFVWVLFKIVVESLYLKFWINPKLQGQFKLENMPYFEKSWGILGLKAS